MHFENWRLHAAPIPITTKPSTVLVGAPRSIRWFASKIELLADKFIFPMED
jgi:hypothetical protein